MFRELGKKKLVLGLVHLVPLPGTPLYEEGNFEIALDKAIKNSTALFRGGVDGCLVQTTERIYPSGDDTDYARLASMAVITHEVRRATSHDFKIGVQMMWNCITPSLAVAKATKSDFVRCVALFGASTSPYGIINADPYKVQLYRRNIGAQKVAMISEIEGFHYHWLGDDIPIEEKAQMAMKVNADAVEVVHHDEEINNKLVHDIKAYDPTIPVVVGGRTNPENAPRRLKEADAVLVGSYFEDEAGYIDEHRVREYMDVIRSMEK
jgi:membrane complex biogenesis BtpA family protein